MPKQKTQRDKVRAWKKEQERAFLESLPFERELFQALFRHLDGYLGQAPCQHDFRMTAAFLKTKGIDFEVHREFFVAHGGGCDCEVLFNVQESFPAPKPALPRGKKTGPVRERLDALTFEDLKISRVPAPWRLFRVGSEYELQMGKKADVKVVVLKGLVVDDWTDDGFWKRAWEVVTELPIKAHTDVGYEQLGELEMVTVRTSSWTPVLTWVRKKDHSAWGLLFKSQTNRFSSDMQAFRQLLKVVLEA